MDTQEEDDDFKRGPWLAATKFAYPDSGNNQLCLVFVLILSLIPSPALATVQCYCKDSRNCLRCCCAGDRMSFLLREDDPSDYRSLLNLCFVVISDDAPSLPHFDLKSRWSQPESCLALRYEALILREMHSVGDKHLHVSYREWVTFAEHALENGFHAIARKACEKALACFQTDVVLKTEESDTLSEDMEAIRKVMTMKDIATVRASSQSVQGQTVDYLKRKAAEHDKVLMPVNDEKGHSASILFRNGIKKHNARKLQQLQRVYQIIIRLHGT